MHPRFKLVSNSSASCYGEALLRSPALRYFIAGFKSAEYKHTGPPVILFAFQSVVSRAQHCAWTIRGALASILHGPFEGVAGIKLVYRGVSIGRWHC